MLGLTHVMGLSKTMESTTVCWSKMQQMLAETQIPYTGVRKGYHPDRILLGSLYIWINARMSDTVKYDCCSCMHAALGAINLTEKATYNCIYVHHYTR